MQALKGKLDIPALHALNFTAYRAQILHPASTLQRTSTQVSTARAFDMAATPKGSKVHGASGNGILQRSRHPSSNAHMAAQSEENFVENLRARGEVKPRVARGVKKSKTSENG